MAYSHTPSKHKPHSQKSYAGGDGMAVVGCGCGALSHTEHEEEASHSADHGHQTRLRNFDPLVPMQVSAVHSHVPVSTTIKPLCIVTYFSLLGKVLYFKQTLSRQTQTTQRCISCISQWALRQTDRQLRQTTHMQHSLLSVSYTHLTLPTRSTV